MRPTMTRRVGLPATAAVSALVLCCGAASAANVGTPPPPNPGLGAAGSATMHADSESSDTTPYAGPGEGTVHARFTELASACPTILAGADGYPQALCTSITGRTPTVHLLDPDSGRSVASLRLAKGSLLGGVYAYLDAGDRMVTVDGNGDLLRVAHDNHGPHGAPRLYVASSTPIQQAVSWHCGGGDCDSVTSLMPDYHGRVWFATQRGAVGVVDPATGTAHSVMLPAGEHVSNITEEIDEKSTPTMAHGVDFSSIGSESIDNSISTAPEGTAVATDHALYLMTAGDDGTPRIRWRRPYDRGPARKPGQLSWGTGASPTFFGPNDGTEYLAITDNAVPREHLLVYDTRSARQVCSVPVLRGTEDSPVASGRSVFVSSTYGYPYPALPSGAGPSEPPSAPFTGGMARVDVRTDASGCDLVWANQVRSAAVPRLSTANGTIYTVTRKPLWGNGNHTGVLDRYSYTTVDANTGTVGTEQPIGLGFPANTLETVGTITPDNVLYQGTVTGIYRMTAD